LGRRYSLILFSLLVMLIAIPSVHTQLFDTFAVRVGARGDDASIGNMGVQVKIRTHAYNATQGDFDYFYVANNLNNGGFVQFGYGLEPGYACLKGRTVGGKFTCLGESEHLGLADVRWQWHYWPNSYSEDFYYEIGPSNSAGPDGSWHIYSIVPDNAGGWSFLLDGQQVSYVAAQWTRSRDAAYFGAQKNSYEESEGMVSAIPTQLGPVEFQDLAYLKDDGWHYATSLHALVGCPVEAKCGGLINPYGVMAEGAGTVIAGSGIAQPKPGDLLWSGLVTGITLTLDLPALVTGLVDERYAISGHSLVSLPLGPHTIELYQAAVIDAKTRLRFDHWGDGSISPNRTITLTSDATLKATYVKQHFLTIDSVVPLEGSGWYDEESVATFSAPASVPIHAELGTLGGQWDFDGWSKDEGYATTSPTGTIVMDEPHSLQAHWHQDYTIPLAVVILLVLTTVIGVHLTYRRKRHPIRSKSRYAVTPTKDRFPEQSYSVNLNKHLILFAVTWELAQVLILVVYTPPFDGLLVAVGLPTQSSLPLYAFQSLFFHALAIPFIAALTYIVLLKFPVKKRTSLFIMATITAGFLLTSVGGMGTAFLGSSLVVQGVFSMGLILSFLSGLALLLGLWPRDFSKSSPRLGDFDLPRLVLWLCVLSVLSTAALGSYAAMGSQAWGATGTVSAFGLVKAAHEHVIITVADVAIVILIAEHYGVRRSMGISGIFGRLGYYLCLLGVPFVTITTYASVPFGVEAHNAITPSAILLLQGALFFMYGIFADLVRRQKTGNALSDVFRGVFADPLTFGLLFIFFWVNVVVTLPGIYVAVNLQLFRGLPNERPFIIGHEHALITLSAIALLLLTIELFQVRGWTRKLVGAISTFGYTISTGAAVPYVFLDPNPYTGVYMPFIQMGILLMVLGTAAGTAALFADMLEAKEATARNS
jgi:hypothetical protein